MIYPHIQANSPAGRTGIWWALERYLCLVWIPCSSMHGRVDIFANMVPIVSTPASNALSGVGWQLNWLNLTAHHGIAHPSPFRPENGLVFRCWISSTFKSNTCNCSTPQWIQVAAPKQSPQIRQWPWQLGLTGLRIKVAKLSQDWPCHLMDYMIVELQENWPVKSQERLSCY